MLWLIIGASASGKSEYAENLAVSIGRKKRIYIATMRPADDECLRRIARHQKMRAEKGFSTIECYCDLKKLKIPPQSTVLLECLSNLVANELYIGAGKNTESAVIEGIRSLKKQAENLIIVSNEVFCDGEKYDPQTQEYIAVLGRLNQEIAKIADTVIEIVYSIPIFHKGEERK
ncbi:bifunctional adenosylcobinamide kinase/adenosylcobinamide-phosphate guanylyltransferase [Youxingia wuxianensis]|uniref:Adenosylcobinamide kinase n=1 Tax=Youxingia wuxianensis TaxID=2763678 RepID=A0A926ER21_9FIRM|nr:bifunctional adenosylcobinamide kinase/adenosylcobinamide-phosphate guanylyltransferase [Youxingia wuxianensis]MBC8585082.1 bifunctional adenosylcobinamide kinase/adenosylcobinamide-phosphate guanylyltransferase [Youxingia wuxianensis]